MRSRILAFVAVLAVSFAFAFGAIAADYPTRPITIVVAFPPGGPSDVLARIVGKKMEQIVGQHQIQH